MVTSVPSSSVTVTGNVAALAEGAGAALAGDSEVLADGATVLGAVEMAVLGAVGATVNAGEPDPEHAATTRVRTAARAAR